MQGALKALRDFMYQLEHLAVLFALLNVKSQRSGPEWRKRRYARIIKLLEDVQTDQHFKGDMSLVVSKMWDTRILSQLIAKAKHLSGPQLGRTQLVTVTTACDRLDVMSLYVDTAADQKREDAAGSVNDDKDANDDKDNADEDEGQDSEQDEDDMATQDARDTQADAGIESPGRVSCSSLLVTCSLAGILSILCTFRYYQPANEDRMHGSHVIACKYYTDKLYMLQLGPSSQVRFGCSLCAHVCFSKLRSAAMAQWREDTGL